PMDEFPVFVKEGAIIPMDIKRSYTGLGDADSENYTTILIYPKIRNHFTYYHTDQQGETDISYIQENKTLMVRLGGSPIGSILRIHSDIGPKSVELDGNVLEKDKAWNFDAHINKLIIRTDKDDSGNGEY